MSNCCPKQIIIGRIFFFAALFLKINTENNGGKKAHISPKTEASPVLFRERCEDQVIKALLEIIGIRGLRKGSRVQSLIIDVQTSEEIFGNISRLE